MAGPAGPITVLSPIGLSRSVGFTPKTSAGLPPTAVRVPDFDTWRAGYAGALVEVMVAGTTDQAPIFFDQGLTQPVPNPVTLSAQTDANGVSYGKWPQPIYAAGPYYLLINGTDSTGVVEPPITDLVGEDATNATALSDRGQYELTIGNWLDQWVLAAGYGPIGTGVSPSTTTATLAAAIGAAAAQGGGEVVLPAGTLAIQPLVLPQGVVLRGQGMSATTLSCVAGQSAVLLGGDGAGLRDLTLDGIQVAPLSIGVDMTGRTGVVFESVTIQRFALGLRAKGVIGVDWRNLSLVNNAQAADIRGDMDASGSNAGSNVSFLFWRGGTVGLSPNEGLHFEAYDQPASNILLEGISFSSNTGNALHLTGVRNARFSHCSFGSNTAAVLVEDGSNTAYVAFNQTDRITFQGGSFSGGTLTFNGTCERVVLDGAGFTNNAVALSVPANPILFKDCRMDALTTFSGDLTKYVTIDETETGDVAGVTTDGNSVVAWSLALAPGEVVLVNAKAVAKQRNGINWGDFWVACGASAPSAALAYVSGTVAFTVGAVLSGRTSGASARIRQISGSVSYGSLAICDIVGTFQSGESIVDSSGGAAQVSGGLVTGAVVLDAGGSTAVRPPESTATTPSYGIAIIVQGTNVQVTVTGVTGHTVEWLVKVEAIKL